MANPKPFGGSVSPLTPRNAPGDEGRGIGLVDKIRAYELQETGRTIVVGLELLGFGRFGVLGSGFGLFVWALVLVQIWIWLFIWVLVWVLGW